MFSLRKPTFETLNDQLCQYRQSELTYAEVGLTREGAAPAGYRVGQIRVRLGEGQETFAHACELLTSWQQFPHDFVELVWPCPLEVDQVICTLFHAPGFWMLNPCRIVYTLDERTAAGARFGFGYGTVGDHFASGEERFEIRLEPTGVVWYEIYCFSRARHWIAKCNYPYLRLQQFRFRRLSARSMREAVHAKRRPDTAATL